MNQIGLIDGYNETKSRETLDLRLRYKKTNFEILPNLYEHP